VEDATTITERRRRERTPFRRSRRASERISALGVEVDLVRPEEVMHLVCEAIDNGEQWCVANHNAHSIYLTKINARFADFFRKAELIEVDSTPLIFFTRALGLHSRQFHRCTYLDWRDHFWSLANRNAWRVYYLGGADGVAERAADSLAERYPDVKIATRSGYFDAAPTSAENAEVLAEINAFAPQILFVGMGMPRQELWIGQNRERLPACIIFSVGAAFDYEAGVQCPAPRWMGPVGLEWLFRLVGDPKRLFFRYCIEPWFLLPAAGRDVLTALSAGRFLREPPSLAEKSGERGDAPA